MTRLRTYAPMKRQSSKIRKGEGDFRKVYKVVDLRSDGRCECNLLAHFGAGPLTGEALRCTKRATDHHHVLKPRRSYHNAHSIVHLCRFHHDRCEWPYKRGRLVVKILGGGQFSFAILFASDKFAALKP